MIRMLFVDDSHTRHDFLCGRKHRLHGGVHACFHEEVREVLHVYTAADAITLLEQSKKYNAYFDIISLDHDMSQAHPEQNNGMLVVDYMIKTFANEYKKHVKVFVHSWSKGNKEEMVAKLIDAGFDCKLSYFYVA